MILWQVTVPQPPSPRPLPPTSPATSLKSSQSHGQHSNTDLCLQKSQPLTFKNYILWPSKLNFQSVPSITQDAVQRALFFRSPVQPSTNRGTPSFPVIITGARWKWSNQAFLCTSCDACSTHVCLYIFNIQ